MKLYTFVVHYLQMCMKEYGCYPKFKRGDDSTYAFTKRAHLQVVYYKCVKFHINPISGLGGVALARYMDGRTDGRTDGQDDSYIPPNFVCGAYNN
jgi:hypothetical protein